MDELTKGQAIEFLSRYLNEDVYTGKCIEAHKIAIEAIKKLARYENLADNGRLKELPCREGTRVYKITTQRDSFDDREYPAIIQASFRLDMLNNFGKTVFLTHEDAEEKMGGENND